MKQKERELFWYQTGKDWVEGEVEMKGWQVPAPNADLERLDVIQDNGKKYREIRFFDKQRQFINSKKRYVLYSGGMGCGKTLPLLTKGGLFCLFFPMNHVLFGRRTISLVEKNMLPDFFSIFPREWYKYDKRNHIITFFNGSKITLFGLEALQSGTNADIKKAEQDIKSLNLGGVFIDQLEEVEERVFRALRARLRRDVPLRQMNFTCNPANFWAYDYFKANPRKNTDLIEGSMLDNKENLPEDYIEDQMNNPQAWIDRYVHGKWDKDIITQNNVFYPETIKNQEMYTKEPKRRANGIQVFEEKNNMHEYQIGCDPSNGTVDPCHASCVDKTTGREVANFSGYIATQAIADKLLQMAHMFTTSSAPLILLETNEESGAAVLEKIKYDYSRIYEREVFDRRKKKRLNRLGWRTNRRTKQILIANFQGLLRENRIRISEQQTLEEMKVFVWSDEAKKLGAGAASGHDDRVMGTMLAYFKVDPQKRHKTSSIEKEMKRIQTARRKNKNEIKV